MPTKLSRRILLVAVACSFLITAATVALRAQGTDGPEAARPAQPALTVSTTLPLRLNLPARLGANGSVAAWQEASIGAEAHGLRIAEVLVNVGDVVRRGQVLARFAPETVQAELAQIQAARAEASAHAAEASANAERARSLATSGALSEQQIQQFITAEQTALARTQAQRAAEQAQALRLVQTQVLAPDDGVISARLATQGAVVPGGQELFRLIRGARLEWRAEVTAEEAVRLQPGMAVVVHGADGSKLAGRLRKVAPTVDTRSRAALVYVDLPAAQGVRAGMFASGEFVLGQSSALTVPESSLVIRDGFAHVFRIRNDGRVEQIKVRTGRRHDQRVEVLEGITEETPLVASGAGFLNDGDFVKVVAAEAVVPAAMT